MPKTSTSGKSEPAVLRRRLQRWYRENGRHNLPWRLTRDPYAVLVSEVMLQQTQVERVLPYYEAWMARWPDFWSLASVPPSEVIREWRGLGYNRRALNLHRLAQAVAREHGGALPQEPGVLLALPGVGAYTASAIRCFARGEQVVVADTNIARVLARAVLGLSSQRDAPGPQLRDAGEALLPRRNARDHNLALMDLGAMVCQARTPLCQQCPVRNHCAWFAAGRPRQVTVPAVTPRFETTARFARGRIVDALRECPASSEALAAMLPESHRAKLPGYLAGLVRDGMVIESSPGTWSLPNS
ncbi:MAG: A/G-specific adenine glycosylase [Dehalococcoidia bacterium]